MGCTSSNVRKCIQRSFTMKSNTIPFNLVFGVPLIEVLCSEKSPYVAKIVVECIEFIERDENITTDIYSAARPPSDHLKIDKLKEKVLEFGNCGAQLSISPFRSLDFAQIHVDGKYEAIKSKSQNVYVVADVLQLFFKELRPCLVSTTSFQTAFPDLTGCDHDHAHQYHFLKFGFKDFRTEDNQRKLIRYLRCLDAETYDTLKYLLRHLNM